MYGLVRVGCGTELESVGGGRITHITAPALQSEVTHILTPYLTNTRAPHSERFARPAPPCATGPSCYWVLMPCLPRTP